MSFAWAEAMIETPRLPTHHDPEDLCSALDDYGCCVVAGAVDEEVDDAVANEMALFVEDTPRGTSDFAGAGTRRTGLVVGVRQESGEDLHSPSTEAALSIRQRLPRRDPRRAGRYLSALGHQPHRLLAGQHLFAPYVPSGIETPSEAIDLLPKRMVGIVGCPGGVVEQEG